VVEQLDTAPVHPCANPGTMIEVSPGFGILLVAAATVVVAKAGLTRPSVIAQKAAHSSDRRLLEGILEE
jgi:hypothetical protein